jgi:hypothetical protein
MWSAHGSCSKNSNKLLALTAALKSLWVYFSVTEIDYDAMEPVSLKGKPEPVPVWKAVTARGRFGVDVEGSYKTPFIGREVDLSLLKATYQRTMRESSLQLVTVIGEPGVGVPAAGRVCGVHRRAARTDHLAAGAVAALWRGHHLLGAG